MISWIAVSILTSSPAIAAKIDVPPCPEGTQRVFMPSTNQPLWTGCRDSHNLYQGLLIQFSNQTQIVRIAGVKNSLRHGKEIRAGAPGTYEERHYSDGHLQGGSFLFKSPAQLYQLLPQTRNAEFWQSFRQVSDQSSFRVWTSLEPYSTMQFESGRLVRLQATRNNEDPKTGKVTVTPTDYHFKISPDGRMMALNHPEMKNLFFVDPEALWVLNAADLKAALTPGFGSCKQYAGPIGRFGRHYDHLLYKREASESHHVERLKEIRDRFVNFCVPEDIRENIGTLECPPHLPSPRSPTLCYLPLSDQAKLPYHPRFFKFEFTLKKPPAEFQKLLLDHGLLNFVNDYDHAAGEIDLVGSGRDADKLHIKKTSRGIRWKPFDTKKTGSDDNKNWWEWQGIPGY